MRTTGKKRIASPKIGISAITIFFLRVSITFKAAGDLRGTDGTSWLGNAIQRSARKHSEPDSGMFVCGSGRKPSCPYGLRRRCYHATERCGERRAAVVIPVGTATSARPFHL